MNDLMQGWMNFVMICPKGCGVLRGYLAEDMQLRDRCFDCGTEMEGVRILMKENE